VLGGEISLQRIHRGIFSKEQPHWAKIFASVEHAIKSKPGSLAIYNNYVINGYNEFQGI
jgi:hypothetical protein